MRLTTGQARTRVLGMTFRPGPSPLGGPRPRNSKKDGGERGPHLEKTLARTRGKGTTPGFEGQAGSYIMAQKGTVGADTSPRSPHSVAHCQSASATSALSSRCRCLVARSPLLATSPQCECYGSLLYPSLPAPPPPCYPTGRPCIASIKVQI